MHEGFFINVNRNYLKTNRHSASLYSSCILDEGWDASTSTTCSQSPQKRLEPWTQANLLCGREQIGLTTGGTTGSTCPKPRAGQEEAPKSSSEGHHGRARKTMKNRFSKHCFYQGGGPSVNQEVLSRTCSYTAPRTPGLHAAHVFARFIGVKSGFGEGTSSRGPGVVFGRCEQ